MKTFNPEIWLVKRRKFNPAQWLQKPAEKKPAAPANKENISLSEEVETVLSRIEYAGIDLTCSYRDWVTMGFAFASDFGELGRRMFHRVSQFYHSYDPAKTDQQYDECLKREKRPGMIKVFFAAAHHAGINTKV